MARDRHPIGRRAGPRPPRTARGWPRRGRPARWPGVEVAAERRAPPSPATDDGSREERRRRHRPRRPGRPGTRACPGQTPSTPGVASAAPRDPRDRVEGGRRSRRVSARPGGRWSGHDPSGGSEVVSTTVSTTVPSSARRASTVVTGSRQTNPRQTYAVGRPSIAIRSSSSGISEAAGSAATARTWPGR